jgi:hypothetical protein
MAPFLLANARRRPGTRAKNLIVDIRGKGTGKTRTMEEIRKYFLGAYSNILPVAISFSSNGKVDEKDLFQLFTGLNHQLTVNYLVVSRILSGFYGISLQQTETIIRNSKMLFEEERNVVEATIDHMIQKIRSHNKSIDYFFLFIDEIDSGNAVFPNEEDPFRGIQSSLLDSKYDNLHTALVVNSRSVKPFRRTLVSRSCGMFSLFVPKKLKAKKIVENIWKKTLEKERLSFSPSLKTIDSQLLQLATIVNSYPELVQLAKRAISTFRETSSP